MASFMIRKVEILARQSQKANLLADGSANPLRPIFGDLLLGGLLVAVMALLERHRLGLDFAGDADLTFAAVFPVGYRLT
jgi:hypothetical protein